MVRVPRHVYLISLSFNNLASQLKLTLHLTIKCSSPSKARAYPLIHTPIVDNFPGL